MRINADYSDPLLSLNNANVKYLIVGAYAVAVHTEPRFTKDIDVWVEPTRENAARVFEALRRFGAPLGGIDRGDFALPDRVIQFGVEPNRIDVLTGIDGVRFETAWRNRLRAKLGKISVAVLSKPDLIRAKRASGRPQDLLDVERLRSTKPRKLQPRKRK